MEQQQEKALLIKGKAGLGNRLLAAATGLLFGRITNRTVYIDWSDETYSNHGENVFPAYFQVPEIRTDFPFPSSASVAPAVWSGHLAESAAVRVEAESPGKHGLANLSRFSADLRRIDNPEEVLVLCRYTHGLRTLRRHFSGKWQSLRLASTEELLSQLLLEFGCTEEIAHRVNAFASQFFRSPTIGVHIRHMDRSCGLQPFLRRVDALRKRIPGATVFLATDDAELNDLFRQRYDACMTTKWYPSSGISLHQNNECPDRQHNGVEALTDLYLLSRCDFLVYPGSSTFSWVARLLSANAAARFYDVERYALMPGVKRWVRNYLYT